VGLLGHEARRLVEPERQLLASERNPAQLMTKIVVSVYVDTSKKM